MSAKASTAAADVPVRRKTSKKATYRADLLQEPDKDTHQHAAEANEFESQLMDVGKRLIAVSLLMCGCLMYAFSRWAHRRPETATEAGQNVFHAASSPGGRRDQDACL